MKNVTITFSLADLKDALARRVKEDRAKKQARDIAIKQYWEFVNK